MPIPHGLHRRCVRSLIATVLLLLPHHAEAIPTYARQYRMSCSVCHSPVPKLTPFGEAFAANGFQLKSSETPTVPAADSNLSLMSEFPVAVRFDGFARAQSDADATTDIEWPFVMKIFSSGQIKTDISYFFYFLMNEGGTITGIEDAFLYFNDIGGQKLDITLGQFQVADLIFKRELRPTFEDYRIYQTKPGRTKADLTYDRGIILNYTLPSRTDLYLSVVNGNGIGPSTDGLYDSDPYKNFVVRLAQPINSSLTLGSLGYLGKERTAGSINRFWMAGGDATITIGHIELLGEYIHRHDANPFFLPGRDSTADSRGGFAQLTYAPDLNESSWYLFLLYNDVRSDIEDVRYQSIAANFSYLLTRNFKLTAEYGYDLGRTSQSFTVGFMTAF